MSNKFKISQLPSGRHRWVVEWPELGSIHTIHMKWKLLELLFDTLQLDEVGLGNNLSNYGGDKIASVMWIDRTGWDNLTPANEKTYVMNLLFTNQSRYSGDTVNGVVVPTLDDAEALVHEFEKLVTVFLLKEQYETR